MQNKRMMRGFVFFYIIILVTWVVTGLYRYINAEDLQNSPVVAGIIDNSQFLSPTELTKTPSLTLTDTVVKANLLFFDVIFAGIFLFQIVFPKLKQKHFGLMVLFILAGYLIPKIGTIYKLFEAGTVFGMGYTTVNDVLVWLAFTPLNWAVFLYGYYLIEQFWLKD